MRQRIFKILSVCCGALALFEGRAQANTITIGANPTRVSDGVNFKWTYTASLFNGKVRTGEGMITIYDFDGFIPGTAFAPPGWTFSSSPVGTTPTDLADVQSLFDDAGVPNLTWVYSGPEIVSPNLSTVVSLGNFGADSSIPLLAPDAYVTRDRSNPSVAAPDGAISGSFGSTSVPNREGVTGGGGCGLPPNIGTATASPSVLWPPNHQMITVAVDYDVTDECSALTCTLSVTSNEPANGLGDGNTAPDWEIVDSHHVRLRAERSGTGDGRVYSILITCSDILGSTATKIVTVSVPKNQSK